MPLSMQTATHATCISWMSKTTGDVYCQPCHSSSVTVTFVRKQGSLGPVSPSAPQGHVIEHETREW